MLLQRELSMKTIERTSQQNQILFKELDNDSKNLRVAASQLLDVLGHIKNQPKELTALSETLKKIKIAPIENMDDLIAEFNKHAQLTSIKLSTHRVKTTPEVLKEFLSKADVLTKEIAELVKKAFELNQK